jgi:nucleoid DNA-binding protein
MRFGACFPEQNAVEECGRATGGARIGPLIRVPSPRMENSLAAKKKTAKRPTAKKSSGGFKFNRAGKVRTKGEVFVGIADNTGLTRKQVSTVFETLSAMMGHDLGRSGPEVFALPGLAKFTVVHKPATKARKGINPFTGEETMFKAKPARNVVKVRALKGLKDMVS